MLRRGPKADIGGLDLPHCYVAAVQSLAGQNRLFEALEFKPPSVAPETMLSLAVYRIAVYAMANANCRLSVQGHTSAL